MNNELGIKKNLFICLFVYLFICLFVVFPKKAIADSLSLGVFPPIIQITATPPADITTPFTIANLSEQSIALDIQFKPFTASFSENGELVFLANQSLADDPLLLQRVQVENGQDAIKSVSLAPYQQKKLNLHILLPEEEPLSDYYFSVVFTAKPEELTNSSLPNLPNQNSTLQNTIGIATNVLLSIGPKGKTMGSLEEFSAPFLLEKGPVPFTVRVKNTGDHFLTPQGEILIKNMFGQTVGKVDLLPVNILKGTIRAIPDSLQSPDATPSATPNSQLPTPNSKPTAFWNESFLLGPYQATLTIALSSQGPLFQKTVYFVGFPLQSLIGLAVVIIIISLIRSRLKKQSLS